MSKPKEISRKFQNRLVAKFPVIEHSKQETQIKTVKLRFSAPQVLTGTVRLPVNSRERNEGSSNHIGVSSMLKMRDKGYPTRCLAAMTNR